MSGLLAAKREFAGTQFFQHVAIAHTRGTHGDARLRMARCSPRLLITVATRVLEASSPGILHGQREHHHDLVTVDDPPGGVDSQTTICIAVVARPRSASATTISCNFEMSRPAPIVDVEAIRLWHGSR